MRVHPRHLGGFPSIGPLTVGVLCGILLLSLGYARFMLVPETGMRRSSAVSAEITPRSSRSVPFQIMGEFKSFKEGAEVAVSLGLPNGDAVVVIPGATLANQNNAVATVLLTPADALYLKGVQEVGPIALGDSREISASALSSSRTIAHLEELKRAAEEELNSLASLTPQESSTTNSFLWFAGEDQSYSIESDGSVYRVSADGRREFLFKE